MTDSPLDTLPTTRRAILNLLKRQGPLEANKVAQALSLTSAAVRMQLVRLEDDGLLARHESASDVARRGRPSHKYTLTSAAEALYPKRYGDLTTELLGYLGGPDGEQVDELFERRRQRRVEGARPRTANLPFDEQVTALAAILDEDGYLADAEEAGGWKLARHRAQLRHPHGGPRFLPGVLERNLLVRDALPGAKVERVAHLMDGAHVSPTASQASQRPWLA